MDGTQNICEKGRMEIAGALQKAENGEHLGEEDIRLLLIYRILTSHTRLERDYGQNTDH